MKISIRKGFSFGLTSGIITTLGMIVGLDSSTKSKTIVLGGIVLIAVADAFSDSLGMHISQESELHSQKDVWTSTISTFVSKFVFAITFIIPFMLFSLQTAVIISIIWGLSLISSFSYYLAKKEKINPLKVIGEHLLIAVLVIIATHYIGDWVALTFR